MGGQHSTRSDLEDDADAQDIGLDDFKILRTIGKGTFGKVCIVQKHNTKRFYALKYVTKLQCVEKDAFTNVSREIKLLSLLNHPFLVNLWFSFQDQDYFFLVFDLLLGGDLRFHLSQRKKFALDDVKLYLYEIAMSLDYIQKKGIIHRDLKPDNLLLDDQGHVHLTDFNIATVVDEESLATSTSGTKPYIAPEIYGCSIDVCPGYGYAVDWWSLGVVCYELLAGSRPYDIRTDTTNQQAFDILTRTMIPVPLGVDEEFMGILGGLLAIRPEQRISNLAGLQDRLSSSVDFTKILRRLVRPTFVPPEGRMNCDPTFELEETIIESNPLQKRKKNRRQSAVSAVGKRGLLEKQNSRTEMEEKLSPTEEAVRTITRRFSVYNREKLLRDEEERVKKLEIEMGLRPSGSDALIKRLGRQDSGI